MSHHPPEAVLLHLDWVQALARRLVADPARAEDLGQEAALVAVHRPPRADQPLRAWLGGVVRNLARRERRAALRRAEREARAARREELPSTVALLEKLAVERRVVEAVLALAEPYRTTVLLRWFEGLSPRRIARRTGLPEATVKTRLRRALALLRAALDADFGSDRRAWLAALLPTVSSPGAIGAAATGALIVNAKTVLVSASLVACAGFGWWWSVGRPATPTAQVAPLVAAQELDAPAAVAVQAPAARAARRVPLAPSESVATALRPTEEPPQAHLAARHEVHGRVVDLDLEPVAGVQVQLSRTMRRDPALVSFDGVPASVAQSDIAGRFTLSAASAAGRLTVADERYVTVMDAYLQDEASSSFRELTLVVAPRRTLEGRVVDASGNPVAGADIAYETRVDLRRRLEAVLDRSQSRTWSTRSDAQGAFALADVPELPEAFLSAVEVGYARASVDLPAQGDQRVVLVLAPLAPDTGIIVGRVLDRFRDPVDQALVSAGDRTVRSDAEGRFQLEPLDPQARRLTALKAGHLPGVCERAAGAPWPARVELVLGETPLAISGRVIDEHGEPVPDATIRLADATRIQLPLDLEGQEMFVLGRAESVLRGADGLADAVEAGADGSFVIGGLLPRDYGLFLASRATLATAEAGPFAAGARGIEVVLPRSARSGPLVGRVLASSGAPLAGVTVQPQRFFGFEAAEPLLTGTTTESAEDGSFRFAEIVYDDLRLGLHGGPLTSFEEHDLASGSPGFDPSAVRLVVRARCHFHVELTQDPERADAFALLDAQERPIPLFWADGQVSGMRDSAELEAGRSQVLSAPEGPATLVLYRSEAEVQRLLIELRPGELNRIRL